MANTTPIPHDDGREIQTRRNRPEHASSPQGEAKGLLYLLVAPPALRQNPAKIREFLNVDHCDTKTAAFRRSTQLSFDALLLRISVLSLRKGEVRLLHRANGKLRPSSTLEAEILNRLRANQSTAAVARDLRVPHSAVRHISQAHHTAFGKRGRGRKYTSQQITQLVEALRAGAVPIDLQREHGICAELLLKLRREYLNDFADRRHRHGWNIEAVKDALARGQTISEVERVCGIGHQVLWKLRRRKLGDFTDRRRLNRRMFSDEERNNIIADIHAGITQRAIAARYHTHYQQIRRVQIEIGLPPRSRRRFTTPELGQIYALIAAGKKSADIAHDFNCTNGAIWARRRRMGLAALRRTGVTPNDERR